MGNFGADSIAVGVLGVYQHQRVPQVMKKRVAPVELEKKADIQALMPRKMISPSGE